MTPFVDLLTTLLVPCDDRKSAMVWVSLHVIGIGIMLMLSFAMFEHVVFTCERTSACGLSASKDLRSAMFLLVPV